MRIFALLGTACAAAVGALCVVQGHAADLGTMYPAPAGYAEPDASFEFGTGWYLRGDVGYSDAAQVQPFGDLPKLTSSTDWTGGIGAGYRWTNWFRTDLSLNFDGYQEQSGANGVTDQICAYQLTGLTSQVTGFKDGYLWTPQAGTCSDRERADLLKTDVMVGGYIDLGTWSSFTPYVGAGVGFARVDTWSSIDYVKNSDGTAYRADLTGTGGYPEIFTNANGVALTPQPVVPTTGLPVSFAPQNWSKSTHRTQYNFAWSLMGGVAYAIDDHLSLDLGYRYVNLGSYRDASGSNKTLDAQQVRLGVRYAID